MCSFTLTTQQAAAILGASRPFLIMQMKEKRRPFRRVETRRSERFDDLMAYKNRIDADRAKALEEVAASRARVLFR